MNREQFSELNRAANTIYSHTLTCSDDYFIEEFGKSKSFSIHVRMDSIHFELDNAPQIFIKTLLDLYLLQKRNKIMEAANLLLKNNIDVSELI